MGRLSIAGRIKLEALKKAYCGNVRNMLADLMRPVEQSHRCMEDAVDFLFRQKFNRTEAK